MKKQTIAPAQQAGISTLEMWLNRDSRNLVGITIQLSNSE